MVFTPNASDHVALESFIERVLDAYKDGDTDKSRAVGVVAHVVTAAAIGNQPEFKAYLALSNERLFEI